MWLGTNFGMNLLLLWVVGELDRKKSHFGRLALAAGVGAVWACLELFFGEKAGLFRLPLTFLLLPVLLLRIAFPIRDLREGLRLFLLWYLAACFIGGLGELLVSRLGAHVWSLLFLAASLVALVKEVLLPLLKGEGQKQRLYEVKLSLSEESTLSLRALLDTGNRLYEPYRQRPVCIVQASYLTDEGKKKREEVTGMLMIPYQAVGTQSGLLRGFVIPKMEIVLGEKKTVQVQKPVLAVYEGELSPDGSYGMLLHGDLLK
ncbi:MAG: sigma-E processing peptidase SpoIIGA [bacterium]|nr:sigma-E processing peptidase SpoIIGA [bacterium]